MNLKQSFKFNIALKKLLVQYCIKILTLSLRQAGAVLKKFDCFFLVYWVHLNDIHQILGGWFTRCLETSMYHI